MGVREGVFSRRYYMSSTHSVEEYLAGCYHWWEYMDISAMACGRSVSGERGQPGLIQVGELGSV